METRETEKNYLAPSASCQVAAHKINVKTTTYCKINAKYICNEVLEEIYRNI